MTTEARDSLRSIDHDPGRNSYRAEFDTATIEPSLAVVSVMEIVTGREASRLDPLYTAVDPVALDELLARTPARRYEGDCRITFDYHGYEVRIQSFGTIRVRPTDAASGDDEP